MAFGQPSGTGEMRELPTCCWLCGRHAVGIGANPDWGKRYGANTVEPQWLCEEHKHLGEKVRKMKRADFWELHALEGGVEAVGNYLDEIGIYDLSMMDRLQANTIVKLAWEGCAKRLGELLEESNGELPKRGRK